MYSIKDKGEFSGKGKGVSDEEILFDLFSIIEEMGYKGWVVAQKEDNLIIVGNDPFDLFSALAYSSDDKEPEGDN